MWCDSDRRASLLEEQSAKAPEGLCAILPVSGEFSYSLTCWKDKGVCRRGVTHTYTDTSAEKMFILVSQPLCLQRVPSLLLLMGLLALGWHQHFCHRMGTQLVVPD